MVEWFKPFFFLEYPEEMLTFYINRYKKEFLQCTVPSHVQPGCAASITWRIVVQAVVGRRTISHHWCATLSRQISQQSVVAKSSLPAGSSIRCCPHRSFPERSESNWLFGIKPWINDHLNKQLIPSLRFQASLLTYPSTHPSPYQARIPAHFVLRWWGQRTTPR